MHLIPCYRSNTTQKLTEKCCKKKKSNFWAFKNDISAAGFPQSLFCQQSFTWNNSTNDEVSVTSFTSTSGSQEDIHQVTMMPTGTRSPDRRSEEPSLRSPWIPRLFLSVTPEASRLRVRSAGCHFAFHTSTDSSIGYWWGTEPRTRGKLG